MAELRAALPDGDWVFRRGIKVFVPTDPKPFDPEADDVDPLPRSTQRRSRAQEPKCGTRFGYRRHVKACETTCGPCRAAWAEWQLGLDERNEAKRKRLKPHGTHAAFNRHRLRGDEPCDMCWMGERQYQRNRSRERRQGRVAA